MHFPNLKKNLFLLICSVFFSFLILETTLYFLVRKSLISIDQPAYSLDTVKHRFWADINPYFGTWHENFAKYHLKKSCIDVEYEANSYGARDVERSKFSQNPRVIVLGDSFVEGYGVSNQTRFTDLLEKESGIEHLNFGTSGGFGPTQYYLLYKTLAKNFSHEMVMIGILPFNDFFDDDLEFGKKAYSGRYRPYFVGSYPNYQLTYYNQDILHSSPTGFQKLKKKIEGFFRGYTYSYNAIDRLWNVILVKQAMPDQKVFSGYYDYNPSQLDRMKYAIEKIAEEAKGKKVVVVVFPVIADLKRYQRGGEPPLSQELKKLSDQHQLLYIDLLPLMADFTQNWDKYFLSCDGHWNDFGHSIAAKFLKEKIPYDSLVLKK